MALKLDMMKAYDHIEWGFFERMLRRLAFPKKWIRMLMCCVGSVSFWILISGHASNSFVPSRGIMQGDQEGSSTRHLVGYSF